MTLAGVGEGQDDWRKMTLKRSIACFGFGTLLLALSSTAFTTDEVISYSQDGSGAITVNLGGMIPYCDAAFGGFDGLPTNSASVNAVTIDSRIYEGECDPPIGPRPPPVPYLQSIYIGVLLNGDYSVDWVFTYESQLAGPPLDHYSSFVVEAGELALFRDGFESQ